MKTNPAVPAARHSVVIPAADVIPERLRPGHPLAPCRRTPGHPGRCRNTHGTTWEGCCDAAQQPRPTATQPALDLGAAT